MAMQHARNVNKSNSFECFCCRGVYQSVGNRISTWQTRIGSSNISPSLRHFAGQCKKLFIPSAHYKSDGMYATSVRKLVKLSVIIANRKQFDLTVEVAVARCQSI